MSALRGTCLLLGGSALGRGVSALGGVCSGGVCALGVSGLWGCLLLGGSALGVSALGVCVYPSMTEADIPPLTVSQTPVKTLPWPNFIAAGKKKIDHIKTLNLRTKLE